MGHAVPKFLDTPSYIYLEGRCKKFLQDRISEKGSVSVQINGLICKEMRVKPMSEKPENQKKIKQAKKAKKRAKKMKKTILRKGKGKTQATVQTAPPTSPQMPIGDETWSVE